MRNQQINKLTNIIHNRAFISSLLLTILLYAFEEVLFSSIQGKILRSMANKTSLEFSSYIITSLVAFLLLFLYFWVSANAGKKVKLLFFFMFSIVAFIQYGYWGVYNRFVSVDDFSLAATSQFELWWMAATLFFNGWCFLPIIAYLIFLILVQDENKRDKLFLLETVVLLVVISLINVHLPFSKDSGISFTKFSHTATLRILSPSQALPTQPFTFQADTKPQNNIVLIIDESIRADHLSINQYTRPTTPFLEKLAQDPHFYNWGTAVAGATCSPLSNLLLITGAPVGTDSKVISAYYPNVFQYANAMGYQTHYIDAQTNSLWNGLSMNDLLYMDSWITAQDLGGSNNLERDFRAAEIIREIVSTSTGNFIALNKSGVHFLYEYSYPKEQTIWKPIPPNYNYQDFPELVINAYDNGIRFNVDNFFEHLLLGRSIIPPDIIYIYTSDHGQTLFENNESWLHCNFTKREASVPMLILGHLDKAVDTTYQASHSNILPTILDLMNVPLSNRVQKYNKSLLTATSEDSKNRQFTDGAYRINDFDQ